MNVGKFLSMGLVFLACHMAFGQEHDSHQQLAKSQAERFLRMQQIQSQMTPNQELYDVRYYQLNLAMDPAKKLVSGTVDVIAIVAKASISAIELDLFNSLVVDKVLIAGNSVNFTHRSNLLTITLNRIYNPGEQFHATIFYQGNPEENGGSEYFKFDTHNGAPMIWSLSQPFGARAWWPCKDYPSDKADSVDIKITVPNNLIVASNGLLREKKTTGAITTYWWHESYPITTYLVSVAIHPYTVFSDYYKYSNKDSMEIQFYVFPDNYATQRSAHLQTAEMLKIFSNLFGQYPFIREKYGHADFLWSGGMEHQTISSVGLVPTWLIAHELAHQWWGDMITCGNFDHIWLNEGFATYAEALYVEQKEGKQAYRQSINEKQYFGSGTIYSENLSTNDIFNLNLRYRKASWVLHMLRHTMGDSVFFKTLRAYRAYPKVIYGTATTEDFREICEKVSGLNLRRFFQQWIYESYYPQYEYEWTWKSAGNGYDIDLRIDQVQKNTVLFQMPIDIRVHTNQGYSDFVVSDSLQNQTFTLHVDKLPQRLEFDVENWILKNVKSRVVNPTFRNGILLVNGIHLGHYYNEIYKAYENKAFWSELKFSFWDCFPPFSSGYPSTLPKPLGHGPIPAEELGKYSTVIWLGDSYDRGLEYWTGTPIHSYLKAGGNVLLISNAGGLFVDDSLRKYLGIYWVENYPTTIQNCISSRPSLLDMSLLGDQDNVGVFSTNLLTEEGQVLFKETISFREETGIGVYRKPANGGAFRADGGQFVFISGRPYRYAYEPLRSNIEYIGRAYFGEKSILTDVTARNTPEWIPHQTLLHQNYPNPFNPVTQIKYELAVEGQVELAIHDLIGRRLRTLVNERQKPGNYAIQWNGDDDRGNRLASGVYIYQLRTPTFENAKKLIYMK